MGTERLGLELVDTPVVSESDIACLSSPRKGGTTTVRTLPRQQPLPRKRLIHRCNGYWLEEGLPRDRAIEFAPLSLSKLKEEPIPDSEWFSAYFAKDTYQVYLSPLILEGCAVLVSQKIKSDKTSQYRILFRSTQRTIGKVVTIPSRILGKKSANLKVSNNRFLFSI